MTTGRFERRTSYIWYCYPVTEVRKFLFTGLLICDNSASKTQYHAVLTTPDKWRFVGCSEPWKVNVCISQYKSEATGRVFPGRIWRISSYDIWIVNEETWRLEAIKNKQNGKNHETYFFSNSNLAKKLITKRIEKSKCGCCFDIFDFRFPDALRLSCLKWWSLVFPYFSTYSWWNVLKDKIANSDA